MRRHRRLHRVVRQLMESTMLTSTSRALEEKLDPELHLARRPGAEDPAEIGRSEHPVGRVEVRAIEEIEDLPAQLRPHPAREVNVPVQPRVNVRVPRSE